MYTSMAFLCLHSGKEVSCMISVLIKLKWFFKLNRSRYIYAITLLVIAGVLEMIPPRLMGSAIDQIQRGNMSGMDLFQFLLLFIGLMLFIYVMTYIWMYQLFGSSHLVERILRTRLMTHLLKMTPTFYEKNRTDDLMARATNDLKAVSQTAGFGILTLIDATAFMITILFTMGFLISWPLTLAAMLPLPFIALAMSIYGKSIHRRFTE